MKNCFFVLFLTLILSGCGKKYSQTYVSESLQPFVDKFVLSAKIRGVNLEIKDVIIKLGDANDYNPQVNKVGYCIYDRSGSGFEMFQDEDVSNLIIIDEKFWNRTDVNDIQRTELVFHELGHCILGRKHDTRLLNNKPESLMYPQLVSMSHFTLYRDNESYYFDELFKLKNSAFQNNPNFPNDPIVHFLTDQIPEKMENFEKAVFIFSEDGCSEHIDSE